MSELTNAIVNISSFGSNREMRSQTRLQVLMDAELYDPKDFSNPISGSIMDISLGGLSLNTSRRIFGTSEEVDIHFTFSPGDKLILLAKVVRVSESYNKIEYGFQYFNITDENRERLKRFLYLLIR